jgi:hypothetical protein
MSGSRDAQQTDSAARAHLHHVVGRHQRQLVARLQQLHQLARAADACAPARLRVSARARKLALQRSAVLCSACAPATPAPTTT